MTQLLASPGLYLPLAALLGLVIGSFLSMLTWRMGQAAEDQADVHFLSLINGRSACPKCQTSLPWYRLIPVLSWVQQKGRCHHCRAPISPRYPLIELTTAALTVAMAWQFGASLATLYFTLFAWFLIAMTVIDLEHQLLLDQLTLPLLWLGLLINTQNGIVPIESAVWGAAIGYLLLWSLYQLFLIFTGKEGMGYGDFKLLAALGAWFGWSALPQIILVASLASLVITLGLWALKRLSLRSPTPFGPYLAMGGLSVVFWPV
ncbi:MAG: prepilin peptidase [Hydrogenovibrio sp.]|uniref:prepilin peptidase n=1 Tax=Hydrogenovibrio sp. TaxID=2065821 RepID=UPI00286FFA1F|nr:prepilin peptidase [Hydrogenovibrio sp.]MDR9497850.1 prepilin peptidase [Hydrogenovibrio sp.]